MKNCLLVAAMVMLTATSALAEKKVKPSTGSDVIISTQAEPVGSANSGGNLVVGLLALFVALALLSGGDGDGYTIPE